MGCNTALRKLGILKNIDRPQQLVMEALQSFWSAMQPYLLIVGIICLVGLLLVVSRLWR
ncbi:MAG: hypothetical protein SWY16_27065 [Cyanobacteriota bacterium]|nr:hypothetical protein [Cyanobacteriota bacterium]